MNRSRTTAVAASRVFGAGLFGAIVFLGCGGSPGMSRQVSKQLGEEVARVRAAAATHDIFTATARLDDLRRSVFVLRAHGDLSAAASNRILVAADRVQTDFPLIAPTTATTTPTTAATATSVPESTTSVPTPDTSPPKRHHDKGNGNGNEVVALATPCPAGSAPACGPRI